MADARDESAVPDPTALAVRIASLYRAWVDGERSAVDELIRVATPTLWHNARACGLSPASAEDVVQSTWVALAQWEGRILRPATVFAWLLTTTRRNAWKAARLERKAHPAELEEVADRLPAAPPAEDEVQSRDQAARLWAAVSDLDARCQGLLRIIAFEPKPDYQRISEELDMPVGSIGPTRRRCLDKLRSHEALAETG